ncbi:TPA: molecular chaperone [Escherichia coli]|nr:molecular chaperone [Escherichia coli]
MEDIIDNICKILEVPSVDPDEQGIVLDDDIIIYIERDSDSVGLFSPFCALPENINDIIYALSLNYSDKVYLTTDNEGEGLIARLDLSTIDDYEELSVHIEYFIMRVRCLKDIFTRRMQGGL